MALPMHAVKNSYGQDGPGSLPPGPMNRIREIRKAAGLSSDELAGKVGTTGSMIRKLENGQVRLTDVWMNKLAEALECTPGDLISNVLAAQMQSDVEPVSIEPQFADALAARNMHTYQVVGKSMVLAGIKPGEPDHCGSDARRPRPAQD